MGYGSNRNCERFDCCLFVVRHRGPTGPGCRLPTLRKFGTVFARRMPNRFQGSRCSCIVNRIGWFCRSIPRDQTPARTIASNPLTNSFSCAASAGFLTAPGRSLTTRTFDSVGGRGNERLLGATKISHSCQPRGTSARFRRWRPSRYSPLRWWVAQHGLDSPHPALRIDLPKRGG
jgi:hypothetical protein